MKAHLIERPDEHHWVLLDHRVTRLLIDASALALQTWSLDASSEIRLAAPFVLRTAGGAVRTLDPSETEALGPALSLLRREMRSLTVTRSGVLTIEFGDGSALIAQPHARLDAWQVQGAGVLEAMSYVSAIGGGSVYR